MPNQGVFQYAVKLICGKSDGKILAPGVYSTAVNVHNPTYTTVGFRVKVAVALPGLQPGPVSGFCNAKLGPDEALEIDCPDIFDPEIFVFPTPIRRGFIKGFVVIESEIELDVVAVYTAAGATKQVETLHTERVPARGFRVGQEVCVDFELPLTVGTQYGGPAGNTPGDVIFTSNGIPVSVYEFNFPGGGSTFGVAMVEPAKPVFGTSQIMHLSGVALEFDFTHLGFVPKEVKFEFLDGAPIEENLSVNGSMFIGDIASAPASLGGVNISVSTTPVPGGKTGTVTLTGPVKTLRVGGRELWIDNVCARE